MSLVLEVLTVPQYDCSRSSCACSRAGDVARKPCHQLITGRDGCTAKQRQVQLHFQLSGSQQFGLKVKNNEPKERGTDGGSPASTPAAVRTAMGTSA